MTDVTIYNVQNRWNNDEDGKMDICLSDITQAGLAKVWCINFRNMQLEDARLIGVDKKGEHYVLIDSIPDAGSVWAVPKDNIFYDEHSAEKGLFTAHLKYE